MESRVVGIASGGIDDLRDQARDKRRIRQLLSVFCCIDYHLATPSVASTARSESIYKTEKFSDHAPITVDYELAL
jgi:hypothetical protein